MHSMAGSMLSLQSMACTDYCGYYCLDIQNKDQHTIVQVYCINGKGHPPICLCLKFGTFDVYWKSLPWCQRPYTIYDVTVSSEVCFQTHRGSQILSHIDLPRQPITRVLYYYKLDLVVNSTTIYNWNFIFYILYYELLSQNQ